MIYAPMDILPYFCRGCKMQNGNFTFLLRLRKNCYILIAYKKNAGACSGQKGMVKYYGIVGKVERSGI